MAVQVPQVGFAGFRNNRSCRTEQCAARYQQMLTISVARKPLVPCLSHGADIRSGIYRESLPPRGEPGAKRPAHLARFVSPPPLLPAMPESALVMVLMSKPLPLPMLGMPLPPPIRLVMALRSCFSSRPAHARLKMPFHTLKPCNTYCTATARLHTSVLA